MRYHLTALFTVAVWGVTFVSTKVLLVDFSPLWILLLRFAVGYGALWALSPHLLRLDSRRHEWLFAAAGATGVGAYYLLENLALVFSTATAVGVIVAASPLFTVLINALRGDRRGLNRWFFSGFALAMAGLVLVGAASGGEGAIGEASPSAAGALFGDGLALAAALVWAVYSQLVRRIAELGYETIASTKRTFGWGLACIAPTTLAFGGAMPGAEAFLCPENVFNLLFLGLVASAACFATWGLAVKNLGAATSTAYIYLVPAITAAASVVVLGEPFTSGIALGLAMTVGGLIVSQRGTRGTQ